MNKQLDKQLEERYTSWLEWNDSKIGRYLSFASQLAKEDSIKESKQVYRLVGRAIASAADGNFVDADVCLVRLWTMYEAIFVNEEPE